MPAPRDAATTPPAVALRHIHQRFGAVQANRDVQRVVRAGTVLGMALTMTAAGLTVVLGIAWFGLGGQTPPLPEAVRLDKWFTGAAAAVQELPVAGPLPAFAVLVGHDGFVYGVLCALAAGRISCWR